mmetsp:Transcript_13073/g.48885  ORF Transcript_13073/g.48885 Transcript_13073/m.48885 type:complete len:233 (+) Transcript_13073:1090-1788(+)
MLAFVGATKVKSRACPYPLCGAQFITFKSLCLRSAAHFWVKFSPAASDQARLKKCSTEHGRVTESCNVCIFFGRGGISPRAARNSSAIVIDTTMASSSETSSSDSSGDRRSEMVSKTVSGASVVSASSRRAKGSLPRPTLSDGALARRPCPASEFDLKGTDRCAGRCRHLQTDPDPTVSTVSSSSITDDDETSSPGNSRWIFLPSPTRALLCVAPFSSPSRVSSLASSVPGT